MCDDEMARFDELKKEYPTIETNELVLKREEGRVEIILRGGPAEALETFIYCQMMARGTKPSSRGDWNVLDGIKPGWPSIGDDWECHLGKAIEYAMKSGGLLG